MDRILESKGNRILELKGNLETVSSNYIYKGEEAKCKDCESKRHIQGSL